MAGKRAGIHEGERSSLFFQAIRIIREMREKTNGRYPTFAVWENVPGAFSSNQGDDFRAVLEEFCKVVDEGVSVPRPDNNKWEPAGEIVGDGFSVAWRQLDAQFWGVPQRRKRIYLVADFAGQRAGAILFERESLRGNPAQSGTPGQGTASDAAGSTGGSSGVRCLNPWDSQNNRQYAADGVFPALGANNGGGLNRAGICFCQNQRDEVRDLGANNQAVMYALDSVASNSMKSANPHSGFHAETVAKTLQAGGVDPTCNQGGNVIVEPIYTLQGNGIDRADTAGCNGKGWREDVSYTLNTIDRPAVCFKERAGCPGGGKGILLNKDAHAFTCSTIPDQSVCYPQTARTLTAEADASPCIDRGQNVVCYDARGNGDGAHCPTLTGNHENRVTDYTAVCCMDSYAVDCRNAALDAEKTHTLQVKASGGQSVNCTPSVLTQGKPPRKYIIRRLTPLECCRLQGFPDGWGVPDSKPELSADELAFWQGVRDTQAAISGKPLKTYSAASLAKWYNALHTDSAEYKMWGNGIALPCAAFVLEGIAEALTNKEATP